MSPLASRTLVGSALVAISGLAPLTGAWAQTAPPCDTYSQGCETPPPAQPGGGGTTVTPPPAQPGGGGGTTVTPTGGGGTTVTTGGGALPFTGGQVATALATGLAAVGAGGILLVAGRRRRTRG